MSDIKLNDVKIIKYDKYSSITESRTGIISALAGEIWREHYTPIIGAEQVEYMLAKYQSSKRILEDIKLDNYTYFTTEYVKSGEIIGYCACQPKEDYLLLSKLYTLKAYRGNGIARGFVREAAVLCLQYGFDKIRLTVNKHNDGSIAAYKKMGFETVDSVKTDIGEGFFMNDYIMELRVGV